MSTMTFEGKHRPKCAGQLLARVYPGMKAEFSKSAPGHLRELAKRIMASQIVVSSGGPIGYLEPSVKL